MLHGFITNTNFWLVLESTKRKYHSNGANSKKFGIWWHNALIYIICCALLGRISLLWHHKRHPSDKIYSHWPLIHPSATICAGKWLILAYFSLMKYTVWCCFRLYFMSDLKTEIICCFYLIVCISCFYYKYDSERQLAPCSTLELFKRP